MSITLHFKYKDSSLFKNGQTAGFIADCINPPTMKKGDRGHSGPNLYFTTYYIGNAYNDKICLEDIENNLLTNGSGKTLEGRVYTNGDLFINPLNEIYRLDYAEENSNFKFSLKYIGLMKNKDVKFPVEDDIKIYIDKISFYDLKYVTERCMIPVNRGYDSSVNDYRHNITLNLNNTDSIEVGDNITINLNDSDCSAGPKRYDDWNQTYKYSVTGKDASHIYITGLKDLVNDTGTLTDISTGNSHDYTSKTENYDTSTNGLFYMQPAYRIESAPWDACVNTGLTYEQAYRGMYGIKFLPIIKFNESVDNKDRYSFYLRIYLKNIKHIQNGCFSLFKGYSDVFNAYTLNNNPLMKEPDSSTNSSNFEFYKYIELPLIDFDSSNKYYPTFISDYVADKLHPSGNNISVNYTSNPNGSKKQTYNYNSKTDYWSRFTTNELSDIGYSVDKRNYALTDLDYQKINFNDLLYKGYNNIHPMIQYYKRTLSSYDCSVISDYNYDWMEIDFIRDEYRCDYVIASTNLWNKTNAWSYILPILPNKKYKIKSPSNSTTIIAVLKSIEDVIIAQTSPDFSEQSGFTGRISISQNNDYTFTSPSDATYLYLLGWTTAGGAIKYNLYYDGPHLKYKYNDSSVLSINYRGGESAYFSGMSLPNADSILSEIGLNAYSPYIRSDSSSTFNDYISSIKIANLYDNIVELRPYDTSVGKRLRGTKTNTIIDTVDNMSIRRYKLVADVSTYMFSAKQPSLAYFYQLYWYKSDGTCIETEYLGTNGQVDLWVDQPVTAPTEATELWMNVFNTTASVTNFKVTYPIYHASPIIEYFTKEMVAREIHKFIFSPENTYEIVCVDASTGRTFIINQPNLIEIPQIIE